MVSLDNSFLRKGGGPMIRLSVFVVALVAFVALAAPVVACGGYAQTFAAPFGGFSYGGGFVEQFSVPVFTGFSGGCGGSYANSFFDSGAVSFAPQFVPSFGPQFAPQFATTYGGGFNRFASFGGGYGGGFNQFAFAGGQRTIPLRIDIQSAGRQRRFPLVAQRGNRQSILIKIR